MSIETTRQFNSDNVSDLKKDIVQTESEKQKPRRGTKSKSGKSCKDVEQNTFEQTDKNEESVKKFSVDQEESKITIRNGARIETEYVHKERKENDESVKANLARFGGEEHEGEKIVTANNKTALDSRQTDLNLIKESVVSKLNNGAIIAARVLVEMLTDESATNSLKIDCAKEILNRVYGKTFEQTNEACEIELATQLKNYCE